MSLPALDLLRPRAARAAGGLDKVALFHFPNGAHPQDWATHPVGPLETLPPLLTPLQDRLSELRIISGLSSTPSPDATCSFGTPHGVPVMSCLTGTGNFCGPTAVAGSRSVDFEAAAVLGPSSIPSLYVRPYGTKFNISVSGVGLDGPEWVQPVRAPSVLFANLFADGDLSPEAMEALQARRLSILDFVVDEIGDLEASLGAADRERLDFHLTTVRQLELNTQLGIGQCAAPEEAPVDDANDPPDELLPARTDELMDLAVMALRCDITDVLVFSVGMSQGTPMYPFLDAGVPPEDAHQTSHIANNNAEDKMWWLETNRYHMSKFARMLDLLSGADGAEPILDRTATVCFSEMGYGANHSPYNVPCVLAGGGIAGGRHDHLPCATADSPVGAWSYDPANIECVDEGPGTPIADLWLTLLQALGGQNDAFGDAQGTIDGLW